MVYARPSLATYSLPENEGSSLAIESYKDDRIAASYTSEEMTHHA